MNTHVMRWNGVVTLLVIVAISYVDRINISILLTDGTFLHHIGLASSDRARQGLLATAFMLGYGLSSFFFTPFCAALFGVRRSLIGGLFLWGVVTAISPAFESYGLLLASRLLLGVSEGPLFSLASSYIKAHFENHENGKPNALIGIGAGLGLAVGYPLIGYVLAVTHWEMSFYLLGLINVALGIPLVLAFIHMPKSMTQLAVKPRSFGDAMLRVGDIFKGSLQMRNLVLVTLLASASLAYLWGSSNWLPAYLKEARGFSLQEMGRLASFPMYATVIAVLLGGVIIDKLTPRQVPLLFMGASVCVALSVLLAIRLESPYAAAYSLIAANFFWGLQTPAIPSTVMYCSRPEHTASAYGVVNGTAALVAGFMPALMGGVIGWVATNSGASGNSAAGFFAGFALLIGTQAVAFLGGLGLWLRERQRAATLARAAQEPIRAWGPRAG